MDYERNTIQEILSSTIKVCDECIDAVSKAKAFPFDRSVVLESLQDVKKEVERIQNEKPEFERPVRVFFPFLYEKLDKSLRELKKLSPILPLPLNEGDVDFDTLKFDMIDIKSDLLWITKLLSFPGQKRARVSQTNTVDYKLPRGLVCIESDQAKAWCAIKPLFKGDVTDRMKYVKDLKFLSCGIQALVDEGVFVPLLKTLEKTVEIGVMKATVIKALICLCGTNVERVGTFLSNANAMGVIEQHLKTKNVEILTNMLELATNLATVNADFKENLAVMGCTLHIVELLRSLQGGGSCPHLKFSKDRTEKDVEVIQVKNRCAATLAVITKGSFGNCHEIGLTCGLRVVVLYAKENRQHMTQLCLEIILNVSEVASENWEFRKDVFGKGIAAQETLRYLEEIMDSRLEPTFRPVAIKALGYLALVFKSESSFKLIEKLVKKIDDEDQEVRYEAVITLQKLTGPDNKRREVFAKHVVKCEGIRILAQLVDKRQKTMNSAATVLSYLSFADKIEEKDKEILLGELKKEYAAGIELDPEVKECVEKAITRLE